MGTFNASLRTIGDRRGIPAVITVAERQMRIEAGDQEIGEWHLDEVILEPTGESVYRLEVDGDRILIEFEDATSFRDLLASTSRMRNRVKVRGTRPKAASTTKERRPAKAPREERAPRTKSEPKRRKEPKAKKEPKVRESTESGFLARVDRLLIAAENRWGSLLPAWLFTRAVLLGVVLMLAAAIAVPGIVSVILLVAGLLLVLLGAVLYTDNVLASSWLPGRMTPMHVLLIGVTVVMLGVLLGVIA